MECPECKEWKFWYEGVLDPGVARWICGECNNDLFYLAADGAHCAFCGHKTLPRGWSTG